MQKYQDILRDLQNKQYHPVYFLYGAESHYIDKISNYITNNVLSESERGFNQTISYGKDTDAANLISTAKRFPMMAPYQVVIVKEAQQLKKIDELSSYVENPAKSTILVLCYQKEKLDKRTKFALALKKNAVILESKRLYDNKIPEWIKNHVKRSGYDIAPKACMLLSEYLGNDLNKIENELSKLILNIKQGEIIDESLIDKYIGISKDFNIFELNAAIGNRNSTRAYKIINYFSNNTKANPIVVTIGSLFTHFSRLFIYHKLKDKSKNSVASALGINPFFVSEYQSTANKFNYLQTIESISLIREYDLKSKGVNNASAAEGELLKELTFKILHC